MKYRDGIGLGVYDIHSPRFPSDSHIPWVNPGCDFKTCRYAEVKPALSNMVVAAKKPRAQLGGAKSKVSLVHDVIVLL